MSGPLERRWEARREAKEAWERQHLAFTPGPRPATSVEGVHTLHDSLGQSARFWRWHRRSQRFTLVLLASLVCVTVAEAHYGLALTFVAVISATAVVVWRVTTYQTVVGPDGLHIRGPFTTINLTWREVASVADPSAGSPTRTVMVTTASGKLVRTDVPDSLLDEFAEYALRHGGPCDE